MSDIVYAAADLFSSPQSGEGDREAVEGRRADARRNRRRQALSSHGALSRAAPSTRSFAAAHFPAGGEESLSLAEPESEKFRTMKRARRLRRSMTDAELILWSCLRRRQVEGFKIRRQHAIGPYIADFVCSEVKLVIEVDGATHGTDAEIAQDRRRTRFVEAKGWRVIRCRNIDVYDNLDGVLMQIAEALTKRATIFPPRANGEGDREAVEGPPRKARRNVRDKLDRPSRPAAATPSTPPSLKLRRAHFPASGEEKT